MSLSMPDLILTLPAFAHDGPIAVAHLQLVLKHHNEIKFSTAATKIFDGVVFVSRNFYSQAQIYVSRLRRESDLGCTVAGCMLRTLVIGRPGPPIRPAPSKSHAHES
jgi:hypothetical protein